MYKKFPVDNPNWERWLSYRAIVLHDCPKCGAPKEYFCSTPKGRRSNFPHRERMNLLTREDFNKCTVETTSIEEILNKMLGLV